ncbi:MAG: hypothetical protein ACOC32_02540 [Nanoarchaeota archaeon]
MVRRKAAKPGRKKGLKNEVLELSQGKPRKEQEQYILQFSGTQLNAVLLLILSATFIVQGIIRYLEAVNKLSHVKPWLLIVILAFMFLVLSVVSIILSSALTPLRIKRKMSVVSFFTFIIGFGLFFVSLVYMFFIIAT